MNMKNIKKISYIWIVLIVGVVVFNMCTFVVRQDEVAVVKTLGDITSIVINKGDRELVEKNLAGTNYENVKIYEEKGLHFKIPFIQSVDKVTSKYLTYKSTPEIINTRDKREIEIQMYAQYKIVDPVKFKLAVGSKSNVNSIMDDRVYPAIIQPANSLLFNEFFSKEVITKMINGSKERLNKRLIKDFGLYAVDIGINRKNFPPKNISSIEQKMSKQIEKESEKLIAEGDAEYQKRKAKTDKEKKQIIAVSVEKAAQIKADADAEAMRIYQKSLQKDLEFYKFMKRMEVYKQLKDTTIFLDKDNDFLRYINGYSVYLK